MGCNATWETWVVTDDVAWSGAPKQPWTHVIPDGAVLKRVGDQAKRMQRVVIPCEMPVGHHMDELLGPDHINDEHEATWTDDTPGATSHADNTPPADEQPVAWTRHRDQRTPPSDVCPCSCHDGRDPSERHDCPSCGGTGEKMTPAGRAVNERCPRCDGEGWVCDDAMQTQCPPGSHRDCPSCGGTGDRHHTYRRSGTDRGCIYCGEPPEHEWHTGNRPSVIATDTMLPAPGPAAAEGVVAIYTDGAHGPGWYYAAVCPNPRCVDGQSHWPGEPENRYPCPDCGLRAPDPSTAVCPQCGDPLLPALCAEHGAPVRPGEHRSQCWSMALSSAERRVVLRMRGETP